MTDTTNMHVHPLCGRHDETIEIAVPYLSPTEWNEDLAHRLHAGNVFSSLAITDALIALTKSYATTLGRELDDVAMWMAAVLTALAEQAAHRLGDMRDKRDRHDELVARLRRERPGLSAMAFRRWRIASWQMRS